MTNKGKKAVKEGARKGKSGEKVYATIPKEQYEAIKRLEGTMGVDVNRVVASILSMWLYSQDWFLEIIKKQVKSK